MGRKRLTSVGIGFIALFLGWRFFTPAPDVATKAALRLEGGSDVPAIDLSRLGRGDAGSAPTRDLFRFGRSRADLSPVPTPVIALRPLNTPTPFPVEEAPPTPTPYPPLNLSFIGIVDNGEGRKIGSFVKDGEIVLVGEVGQVLANAFRVVRIGTDSAEIEELASGRTRRLALRTP